MSEPSINRRDFGKAGGLALAATALPALGEAADDKPRLKSRILILLRADNCLQLGNVIWQFIGHTHARGHTNSRAE